jgi:hypothetical protein
VVTKEKLPTVGPEASSPVVEVISVGGKQKKGKRKYSGNLRAVQEAERGVSKALWRLTDAASSGVKRWRDETDKSSRKKRDGAVRDAVENASKALGKTLRVASVVPLDASKMLRRLKIRKLVSRLLPF